MRGVESLTSPPIDMLDQCWDYYLEHLNEPEIVAFDGKTVRGFTEWAFDLP